jgi:hypothetical protein
MKPAMYTYVLRHALARDETAIDVWFVKFGRQHAYMVSMYGQYLTTFIYGKYIW